VALKARAEQLARAKGFGGPAFVGETVARVVARLAPGT
jgi:hypothetical protein